MSSTFKRNRFKERIHEIVFEADTPEGKAFDIVILGLIVASVVIVILESVDPIHQRYSQLFLVLEWTFTIIFTLEYILRLYSIYRPRKYATSFFGIIDLLAIIPTYLTLFPFIHGTQYLLVIRALRLMRVFRILKMAHFLKEGEVIVKAMRASRAKITVFLTFIILMVIIIGSIMYLVEGGTNDSFSSIPRSVYWAIVTLTTVGYGDITPSTAIGQFFSALVMVLGYAVIAVPTGIVSAEFVNEARTGRTNTQSCRYCAADDHDNDAVFCKYCGKPLNEGFEEQLTDSPT